ncbi:MAG: hypothetical protein EZS28_036499 [Streblomastix strix]|uniref:Uncharacterized protein n=1 Tax=Streblomastix strix TaxID=222440 RepID=A0A5J4UCM0_9EUKA|nr:MAG: hypothetical protein EZS28_036499 [Streblomastix strix]
MLVQFYLIQGDRTIQTIVQLSVYIDDTVKESLSQHGIIEEMIEKLEYIREQTGNYGLLSLIGQHKEELEQRRISQTEKWINTYVQLKQPQPIRQDPSRDDSIMKDSYE